MCRLPPTGAYQWAGLLRTAKSRARLGGLPAKSDAVEHHSWRGTASKTGRQRARALRHVAASSLVWRRQPHSCMSTEQSREKQIHQCYKHQSGNSRDEKKYTTAETAMTLGGRPSSGGGPTAPRCASDKSRRHLSPLLYRAFSVQKNAKTYGMMSGAKLNTVHEPAGADAASGPAPRPAELNHLMSVAFRPPDYLKTQLIASSIRQLQV